MENNKEPFLFQKLRRDENNTDSGILEALRQKMFDDPHLDASDIEIVVRGGFVELLGSVTNDEEKALAEGLAESVDAVLRVSNKLSVSGMRLDTSFQNPISLRERINKMRLY